MVLIMNPTTTPQTNNIQANDGTPLDPSVVALAKSIRQEESGGNYTEKGKSGEYGAYGFTQPTWKMLAGKYLGNANANINDPTAQDKVAYYAMLADKQAGLSPEQIASKWNSGNPNAYNQGHKGTNQYGVSYDTPAYVNRVMATYSTYKNQAQAIQNGLNMTVPVPTLPQGPTAAATDADVNGSMSVPGAAVNAGIKALINTPGSAYNFAKGAISGMNPVNTVKNIGAIGSGFQDLAQTEGTGKAITDVVAGLPQAAYETLVPSGVRSGLGALGNYVVGNTAKGDADLQQAAKTFINDPFGQAAPVVLGTVAGAQLLDKLTGSLTAPAKAASGYIQNTGDTTINAMAENPDIPTNGIVRGVQQNILRGLPQQMAGQGMTLDQTTLGKIEALDPTAYPDTAAGVSQFVTDASKIVTQGQGLYSTGVGNAISTIAKPVTATGSAIGNVAATMGRSVLSHLTGLDPSTISQIIKDPQSFSRLQREATTRGSVAQEFGTDLQKMIDDKSQLGAEYNSIRSNGATVPVSPDLIPTVLKKFGLSLDDSNQIQAGPDSITRNPADLSAIQKFVDDWASRDTLTGNQFLNMRQDIADLQGPIFGTTKTGGAITVGKALYNAVNDGIQTPEGDTIPGIRQSIPGLQQLDSEMAPQIQLLQKAQKDFLNPDGTFKDGAINKIANATGVGKDQLLDRMEQVSPGITNSINVLKAAQDIERANGIKVGTYTRGVLEAGGALSGNIPVVVATILTSPTFATQILRAAGYVGQAAAPIVSILKTLAGQVEPGLKISAFNQANQKQ